MEKAVEFLKRHHAVPEEIGEQVNGFVNQARDGLKTEGAGSFAMIPAYLTGTGTLPVNEKVIVIDAGGTNLRIALTSFTAEGECRVHEISRYPMPGTKGRLSVEEFFDSLAGFLEPFVLQADTIGFVFSFPCVITPEHDGIITIFDKEVDIPDAPGHYLGKELNAALEKRGLPGDRNVIVLNDTVSTLMGGLPEGKKHGCENYIGLILGTGMNMAYIQSCSGIEKVPSIAAMEGSMCINMEAGGYNGFRQSDFEKAVDAASDYPGHQMFEKMVSGAYEGAVQLEMLKCAAAEGLFGKETAASLLTMDSLGAADSDAFCRDMNGNNPLALAVEAEDKPLVLELLDHFYDRVAQRMAIALTSALLLGRGEGDQEAPALIVADGSTFYKTQRLNPKIHAHMEEIAGRRYGIPFRFAKVEDGNISGAAAAALLNRPGNRK